MRFARSAILFCSVVLPDCSPLLRENQFAESARPRLLAPEPDRYFNGSGHLARRPQPKHAAPHRR